MPLVLRTQDAKQEGQDFGYTLARVVGDTGLMLLQADVESISLYLYDPAVQGATAIYSDTTIDPLTAIFDTPQVDDIWTLPDAGYNFRHKLKASDAFSVEDEIGGHTYVLKYVIETTTLNDSGLIFVVRKVFSSPLL